MEEKNGREIPSQMFLGLGAEKAGTTWIADKLSQHPEVYMPPKKEIFFFNDLDAHFLSEENPRYKRGIKWYKKHFQDRPEKVVGEFSPVYLYSLITAKRIKKHFPKTKLIICLRHPVERAFSQYIHDKRLGVIENISFLEALEKYDCYIKKSKYFNNLQNYFKLFPKKDVYVLTLNEIEKKPKKCVKELYTFLDLKNKDYLPKKLHTKMNSARSAKLPRLNYLLIHSEYLLRRLKMDRLLWIVEELGLRDLALKVRDYNSPRIRKYPKLNKNTREKLLMAFTEEIGPLEKLVKKDLSAWRK